MKKTIRSIAFLILATAVLFSNCGKSKDDKAQKEAPKAKPSEPGIIAEVDGMKITTEDWQNVQERLPGYAKKRFGTPEGKEELLDRMIARLLFYGEGLKMKVPEEPSVKKNLKDQEIDLVSDLVKSRYLDGKRGEEALAKYYKKHRDDYERKGRPQSYEVVKGKVSEDLTRVLLKEYLDGLRKKATVAVNNDLLK